MKLHFSSRANNEILSAFEYITEQNPVAAIRFVDAVDDAVANLRHHPEVGRPTDSPPARVITLTQFPYRIFYEVRGGDLFILSVFHTAREAE